VSKPTRPEYPAYSQITSPSKVSNLLSDFACDMMKYCDALEAENARAVELLREIDGVGHIDYPGICERIHAFLTEMEEK